MISGQVIQNSIDDLKNITKVDLGVFDLEGQTVAATFDLEGLTTELIHNFAISPADSLPSFKSVRISRRAGSESALNVSANPM